MADEQKPGGSGPAPPSGEAPGQTEKPAAAKPTPPKPPAAAPAPPSPRHHGRNPLGERTEPATQRAVRRARSRSAPPTWGRTSWWRSRKPCSPGHRVPETGSGLRLPGGRHRGRLSQARPSGSTSSTSSTASRATSAFASRRPSRTAYKPATRRRRAPDRQLAGARSLRHVRHRVRRPSRHEAHPDAGRVAGPPAAQGLRDPQAGRAAGCRRTWGSKAASNRHAGNHISRLHRTGPQHGSAAPVHARRAARHPEAGRREGPGHGVRHRLPAPRRGEDRARTAPTRSSRPTWTAWTTWPRSPTAWATAWRWRSC